MNYSNNYTNYTAQPEPDIFSDGMNLLDEADRIRTQNGYTFTAFVNGEYISSEKMGIGPMMELLVGDQNSLKGAYVSDKVIGKAAAFLCIRGGIRALHAEIISEHALKVLEDSGIQFRYAAKVPYIINRAGDGVCPMEQSVLEIRDADQAFDILKDKWLIMTGQK